MFAIIVALLYLQGLAKAFADALQHTEVADKEWRNKYAVGYLPFTGKYYLGLYKPRYKEKFMYSTTILVFLTDKWHFANWCYNRVKNLLYFILWITALDGGFLAVAIYTLLVFPVIENLAFSIHYNDLKRWIYSRNLKKTQ
jgi:hypothetical protein